MTTLATVTAIFYLSTFLVHYLLGWWGGIYDLFDYYKQIVWYENSVSTATHPYSSKWYTWPMMLRPVAYWQHFPEGWESRHGMGRRQSAHLVGRTDRDDVQYYLHASRSRP